MSTPFEKALPAVEITHFRACGIVFDTGADGVALEFRETAGSQLFRLTMSKAEAAKLIDDLKRHHAGGWAADAGNPQ